MIVQLAYGQGLLPLELPKDRTVVIAPSHAPSLPDERAAVLEALDSPIGLPPLRQCIPPDGRVCISFSDITRPTPNDRLIPWLLEFLGDIPPERIVLVNQTGSHRPNTQDELARMLTPAVVERYRVINHDPEDLGQHVRVGTMSDGTPAWINRHVVEADLRITTGFIEPHFFAGFSGGPKGIIPGTAALKTILSNHGPRNVGHPQAAFGVTRGNPLWEELCAIALSAGPTFLLNVALNTERRITQVFAGHLVEAHQRGCAFVKATAMQPVDEAFDVVVTTNSGYPLDMNLYQGVKGMSAGARILKPGGTLILACECREGVPDGSPYDRLLRAASGPGEILKRLAATDEVIPEQWQAQIQAKVQQQARVLVHSALPDATLRACHLEPCRDISAEVRRVLEEKGASARVAVLPYGPLTIPYLKT